MSEKQIVKEESHCFADKCPVAKMLHFTFTTDLEKRAEDEVLYAHSSAMTYLKDGSKDPDSTKAFGQQLDALEYEKKAETLRAAKEIIINALHGKDGCVHRPIPCIDAHLLSKRSDVSFTPDPVMPEKAGYFGEACPYVHFFMRVYMDELKSRADSAKLAANAAAMDFLKAHMKNPSSVEATEAKRRALLLSKESDTYSQVKDLFNNAGWGNNGVFRQEIPCIKAKILKDTSW